MFTTLDKALGALVLAVLSIANIIWGIDLFGEATEEWVGSLIAAITPLLVWLLPNRKTR